MKNCLFQHKGIVLSVLFYATPALAEGPSLVENGFYLLDFIVIAYLIKKFGAKPFKAYLVNRRDAVTQELDEAKRLHAEAAERLNDYEEKLKSLEDEKDKIRAGFEAVAEQEKARIIADAETQAARMVEDAKVRIDQEANKLKKALENEAVELAMELATKKVTTALTPTLQQSLVSDALTSIEALEEGALSTQQN